MVAVEFFPETKFRHDIISAMSLKTLKATNIELTIIFNNTLPFKRFFFMFLKNKSLMLTKATFDMIKIQQKQ